MDTTPETDTQAQPYDDGTGPDGELDALLGDVAVTETTDVATARIKHATNRALIRRVANKAAELQTAPTGRKDTLASMLGVGTDLGNLTYAVMTAARTALAPAADLAAIAAEEPWGAAVVATTQGRARMRGVWGLLVKLGADLPAATPPSDAKAGIALAKACHQLPPQTREELAKVVALARKS